jgi:hypothetical protein
MVLFLLLSSSFSLAESDNRFVVIELYTSEGCSSCPPADRLLSFVTEDAMKKNLPVHTLSFHVDYWDYLGWKDPFSKPEFSDRQRRYARILNASSVYTPQMIVNGEYGFAGYQQKVLEKHIVQTLEKANPAVFKILGGSLSSDRTAYKVNYEVNASLLNLTLNIAIVERGLMNQVKRGENSGLSLSHANVVRSFRSTPLKQLSGELNIEIPGNINYGNSSIIFYIQNPKTMKIISAKRIDLQA